MTVRPIAGSPAEVTAGLLADGKISCAVFDLGGVLLQGATMSAASEGRSLAEMAWMLGMSYEAVVQTWRDLAPATETGEVSEWVLWQRLSALSNSPCDPAAVRNFLLEQVYPVDTAVTQLRAMHRAGWRLFLASNHLTSWMERWQEKFDWLACFEYLFVSQQIGVRKPAGRFFAALRSRLPEGEAWFIDDRRENLLGGRPFGLRPILASTEEKWELSND